jgi:ubiquinone/menaquinone biosynthesis C-methylase UbiE
MRVLEHKLILDIGCGGDPQGNVNLDLNLGQSIHHNYDYNVREISNFVRSSASRLPFRCEVFDGVVCSHTLEHLTVPTIGLSEVYRVVKHMAILRVPNIRVLKEAQPEHLFSWSVDSFRNFCSLEFPLVKTWADSRSVQIYEFRIFRKLMGFKTIRRPLERIISRIMGLEVVAYCWKNFFD